MILLNNFVIQNSGGVRHEWHSTTPMSDAVSDIRFNHGDYLTVSVSGIKPSREKPNVAVASVNGMEVDLHLGQTYQLMIYGPREDGLISLLGTRPVPEPGTGSSRWKELAASIGDCFAVLASSAGESPKRILGENGISVIVTEGEIEGTVDLLYGGGKKKRRSR